MLPHMGVDKQQRLRVLLAGPAGVHQQGLELLLSAHGCCVIGTTSTATEVDATVRAAPTDIVLVDLTLGPEVWPILRRVAELAPRLPVLGYGDRRPWPIQELLREGMRGFVLTLGAPERFHSALRTVATGCTYLDPDFAITDADSADGIPQAKRCSLTDRERQILGLLAYGLNGREIAGRLFLSPATVRTHVQNAMQKLGARTRAQAIVLATGGDADGGHTPRTSPAGAGLPTA